MTTATATEQEAVVHALVRGPWSEAIQVVDVGVAGVSDERPAGTPFVVIACDTEVARYQAMISLADHATNDLRDWREGWTAVDGHATLRVWDPQLAQRVDAA